MYGGDDLVLVENCVGGDDLVLVENCVGGVMT